MVWFTAIVMATQLPCLGEAPNIPSADDPIGPPPLAKPLHFRLLGELLQPMQQLDHLSQAKVGAVEGEDHEHVGGPDADGPDGGGEQAEEGSVVHGGERSVGDGPVPEHDREGTQVGGFLAGDTRAAELVGGQGEDGAVEEAVGAAEEGEEAGVGGGGGREGEVVVEDGAGEGVKVGGGGGAAGEGGRRWEVRSGEEERVSGAEVVDSGLDLAGGGEGPTGLRWRGAEAAAGMVATVGVRPRQSLDLGVPLVIDHVTCRT